MSSQDKSLLMRKIALALIICAVVGTEISYHFTLETRFDVIEEKLQQDGVVMQEMQQSLDALAASKTETLSGLNKQLATLQSSFEPLGKTSKDQADAVDRLRQQLITLQQAQSGQEDAQRKLSDYITQLQVNVKKAHTESEVATRSASAPSTTAVSMPVAVPIPTAPSTPAPAAQPASASAAPNASTSDLMSTPGAVSHDTRAPAEPRAQAVSPALFAPATPMTDAAVVLRTADSTITSETHSPRALPVGASLLKKK